MTRRFGAGRFAVTLGAALWPVVASTQSAPESYRVRVVDSIGRPIPYAHVVVGRAAPVTADSAGAIRVRAERADSLKLWVRRIGFEPFEGWLTPTGDGEVMATLRPLARNLARVDIYAHDTPLARRGFYDRMERVQRGAVSAWFLTPEELEQRNAARVSHLLGGQRFIRIQWYDGRPVLTGRSGSCQMVVLVDGVRLRGMLEEAYTPDGQREIARLGGGERGYRQFMAARTSIDDVVTAVSIEAVETYASAASAPVELQRAAGSAPCGLIAIWTGGRR